MTVPSCAPTETSITTLRAMPTAIAVRTDFVPLDLDATHFANVEPYFNSLQTRPVSTVADFEKWLVDRGELESTCSEAKANLYISMTCDTANEATQQAYARYIGEVEPRLTPACFKLDTRYVELAKQFPLPPDRYAVLDRSTKADVELFREENVPLDTELASLGQEYDQTIGAMTVEFEGQERTLPQMARYQENTDRAQREAAWRLVANRRLKAVDTINTIFDRMVGLRHRIARNAGFENFVGFAFRAKHRFDYGVAECEAFHQAVEEAIVPLSRSLEAERATKLGVHPLRPWDLSVDVKGRSPLRPFATGDELMAKSVATMKRLDPRLANMLAELGDGASSRGSSDGACLDLDSRKGKAPGGYQYMRDRTRRPFIFMNSAGLQRDVETMVHEAGHAFHSMLCRNEPLLAYRHSPIEFAEVASMSMELLTMNHWGRSDRNRNDGMPVFYENQEDFARAKREQVKHSVLLLPWIATIDSFQHWIYSNPTHTRAERETAWLNLDRRFGSSVSWDGIEDVRPHIWQRQPHLFGHPFYYIEYGIAQLGALQLWLISLEQGEQAAVERYMAALSLGGSRPLPELFKAAGLQFNFGADMVRRIVDRVQKELEHLPE